MFNIDEIEDKPMGGGGIYLNPGINDNCEIMDVTMEPAKSTGNPMLMVHIANSSNPNVDKNKDARAFRFNFSTTPFKFGDNPSMTGYQLTMTSLLHINNAICKKDDFIKICKESGVDGSGAPSAAQVEDFAERLRDLWRGETLRMKLVVKEYLKDDNSIGKATELGLPPFAEPIQDGAENPVVTETKLTYDENNKYDYKRYTGARFTPESPVGSESTFETTSEDQF